MASTFTVYEKRRRFRRPRQLLIEQDSAVDVGLWLEDYRKEHGHEALRGLDIRESVHPGIEPVCGADPHDFIEVARDALRDHQRLQAAGTRFLDES